MGIVKGRLKIVNEEQVVSDKFKKKEFVIETDGQYPKPILFQLTNDKTSLINSFSIGQEIEVSYNLNGREWVNPQGDVKYFNSLEAWKIDAPQVQAPQVQATLTQTPPIELGDDLPF